MKTSAALVSLTCQFKQILQKLSWVPKLAEKRSKKMLTMLFLTVCCWCKYMENLPALDATLLLRDYVQSSSLAVSKAKATICAIRVKRNRRGRSTNEEKGIVYFNGWQD